MSHVRREVGRPIGLAAFDLGVMAQHVDRVALPRPATYRELSRLLLNVKDAFLGFSKPKGMEYDNWYQHSSVERETALAQVLAAEVDGYMIELGSFLGNSAAAWVHALRAAGKNNATVVCMDTWLGDVNMWHWRRKFLSADTTGAPRLYEQFMINTRAMNVSSQVVPMRVPAVIGLRFLRDLIEEGMLPRPRLVYLDAAHMYPETQLEAEAAWDILAPDGFLVGDDYDHYWPEVQQSVNEFVMRKGAEAFADPAEFAARWPRELTGLGDFGRALLLDAPKLGVDLVGVSPLLKGGQWILKKAAADKNGRAARGATQLRDLGRWLSGPRNLQLPIRLRCCLNGWADYVNRSHLGPSTHCDPPRPFLQQGICRGKLGTSSAAPAALHCRFKYTCRP